MPKDEVQLFLKTISVKNIISKKTSRQYKNV